MDGATGADGSDDFNPRSPYGERPFGKGEEVMAKIFQSTLPLRGATGEYRATEKLQRISIHAPLTGSDLTRPGISRRGGYFNPRSPYGERHICPELAADAEEISIHAPLTGSDRLAVIMMRLIDISIHAPLTGSDPIKACTHASTPISIHAPLTGSDFQDG